MSSFILGGFPYQSYLLPLFSNRFDSELKRLPYSNRLGDYISV